ncbi:DNA modification system-associated small protein [Phocaeicola vulgatus]|uniref:DNA modification system-associated small protein n=1 Tax=Phocaeicola vulgatus TaxID=821 RepID=UPI0032E4FBFB
MAKGIDPKFVHYGIRKDDLAMIEAICEKEEIDFDWLSEDILKAYHAKKVDVIEMSDNDTYNPQNEMFATFQTKRYFIQNETSSKK